MNVYQNVQAAKEVVSEVCGFLTIVCGTFLLNATKDMEASWTSISNLARRTHGSSNPNLRASGSGIEVTPLIGTQPTVTNDVELAKQQS